jgi:uncharacterized protein YkwD
MPGLEAKIYELINEQRHAVDPKAKDLALDSELVGVARQHSVGMAAKNDFADGTGDPHISATRLMAVDAKFQGLLGENVAAQRYDKKSNIDIDTCASRFVETWISSPSHKENLSYADYTRTGVGAALNGDTIYVTQLFATDPDVKFPDAAKPPVQASPAVSPEKAQSSSDTQKGRRARAAHALTRTGTAH